MNTDPDTIYAECLQAAHAQAAVTLATNLARSHALLRVAMAHLEAAREVYRAVGADRLAADSTRLLAAVHKHLGAVA